MSEAAPNPNPVNGHSGEPTLLEACERLDAMDDATFLRQHFEERARSMDEAAGQRRSMAMRATDLLVRRELFYSVRLYETLAKRFRRLLELDVAARCNDVA